MRRTRWDKGIGRKPVVEQRLMLVTKPGLAAYAEHVFGTPVRSYLPNHTRKLQYVPQRKAAIRATAIGYLYQRMGLIGCKHGAEMLSRERMERALRDLGVGPNGRCVSVRSR